MTTGNVHTFDPYKAEGLDEKVGLVGVQRQENESDWDLRKRAFPIAFTGYRTTAFELLFGIDHDKWSGGEKLLVRDAVTYICNTSDTEVGSQQFIEGFFKEDPRLSSKG